jgi:hypothetical protein
MMTFKEFSNLITRLLEVKKDVDNINKALKRFEPDFNYLCFSKYEELIMDSLKYGMKDKNDWIAYFIWERDGKFSKKDIIWDEKDKPLPFRNLQDLYNLIQRK